jgi:hypothetical protein
MPDQIARDEIETERLALDRLDGRLADDLDWRDPEIELPASVARSRAGSSNQSSEPPLEKGGRYV